MSKPTPDLSVTVTNGDAQPHANDPAHTPLRFGSVVEWKAAGRERVIVEFLDGKSPFGWSMAMSNPGESLMATVVEHPAAQTTYKYRASDGRPSTRHRASDPEIVVDGGRDMDK